jgi:hypothetical protein
MLFIDFPWPSARPREVAGELWKLEIYHTGETRAAAAGCVRPQAQLLLLFGSNNQLAIIFG